MWRKVCAGSGSNRAASINANTEKNPSNSKSAKTTTNQWNNTGTASSAGGFGEVQNVMAVAGRRPDESSSVHEMIGIEKRRRRRRKSRPRRLVLNRNKVCFDWHTFEKHFPFRPVDRSLPPPTPNDDGGGGGSVEVSLKQRAVAKLKMFNFTLNWESQCKPCGLVLVFFLIC